MFNKSVKIAFGTKETCQIILVKYVGITAVGLTVFRSTVSSYYNANPFEFIFAVSHALALVCGVTEYLNIV